MFLIKLAGSTVNIRFFRKTVFVLTTLLLASCNGVFDSSIPKHERPVPEHLIKKMEIKGMSLGSPLIVRIFKQENVLEVWKKDHTNRFALLESYEICKWSGKLGPKRKEGDRQAPEGFYHVTPGLMNPNSSYHLSFNMGYPNTYDRANGRTGSHLMVHGACSSAGCYSMTDEYVEEIYSLARESFKGGQRSFQIQAYPFRMTAENMAKNINHPDFEFWKMLKEGSDHFEVTRLPPKVDVCEKRYVFNRYPDEGEKFRSGAECPPATMPRSLALAFNEKQNKDESTFEKILKRNATSPFVPEEERPQSLTTSIKASATAGPLVIPEPEPKVVVTSEEAKPENAEVVASEDAPAAVEAKSEGDSVNPISAEIGGASANTESSSSEPQPVGVPQKADRTNTDS